MTKCKCCGQELPAEQPLNGNAVAYIPLVGGAEWGVSAEFAAELERAYPAVNVLETLGEIRIWNIANPALRKTRRGVIRHINSWFAKGQDRG